MAREYPRFIYSDPFIVHLLKPRMICRIEAPPAPLQRQMGEIRNTEFIINILEVFDNGMPTNEIDGVIKSMRKWAINKTNLHIVK